MRTTPAPSQRLGNNVYLRARRHDVIDRRIFGGIITNGFSSVCVLLRHYRYSGMRRQRSYRRTLLAAFPAPAREGRRRRAWRICLSIAARHGVTTWQRRKMTREQALGCPACPHHRLSTFFSPSAAMHASPRAPGLYILCCCFHHHLLSFLNRLPSSFLSHFLQA